MWTTSRLTMATPPPSHPASCLNPHHACSLVFLQCQFDGITFLLKIFKTFLTSEQFISTFLSFELDHLQIRPRVEQTAVGTTSRLPPPQPGLTHPSSGTGSNSLYGSQRIPLQAEPVWKTFPNMGTVWCFTPIGRPYSWSEFCFVLIL